MAVLKGIGVFVLCLMAVLGILVSIAWINECRRRRRWDKARFSEFLDAGAPLAHPELIGAFQKAPFTLKKRAVSVVRAGRLFLATGSMLAEDPLFISDSRELDLSVPPGDYLVEMLIGRGDDQRCMAIKVKFSENEEATLAPAWTKVERSQALKERQLSHIFVDSANAGIFSAEVLTKPADFLRDEAANGIGENPYLSSDPAALWSEVTDSDRTIGFYARSGMGDGFYPVYVSYDSVKQPVALYLDFNFFGPPKWVWPCQPDLSDQYPSLSASPGDDRDNN